MFAIIHQNNKRKHKQEIKQTNPKSPYHSLTLMKLHNFGRLFFAAFAIKVQMSAYARCLAILLTKCVMCALQNPSCLLVNYFHNKDMKLHYY